MEKMDKTEVIEILKQKLKKISAIKKIPHYDRRVIEWRDSIEYVLERNFGRNSFEYELFHNTRHRNYQNQGYNQQTYLIQLKMRENALRSIINKWESINDITDKEPILKAPLQLISEMQLHPRVLEVSKTLFSDGHYAQAIFEAFKAVENFIQEKTDLKTFGTILMETVFDENNPIIKVPEAGHYYKDVQRGFKHLFVGATQAIRNPKAHKKIIQKDPYITLEYLGFASFLLKRIDYWDPDVS